MDPEFLQFRLGSGDAIGVLAYSLFADRAEYDVLLLRYWARNRFTFYSLYRARR